MTRKDALKVLVIDDSKQIVEVVQGILEESNIEVLVAYDGKEGLEKVQALSPDVVLLDWNMPVLSGPLFLEKFKTLKNIQTKIIMMTGEDSPEFITKAIELGISDYMFKPFTAEILLEKINYVLE